MIKRIGTYLWHHHLALLALFVVLGGTSYAAVNALPKNSVGSKQVINGSLQTLDLSKKARAALKGNRGPIGPQGARGATGAQGAKGATGPQGPATGPAGGSLAGTYPNPTIAADAVGSSQVANGSLTSNDVGKASGTSTLDFPSIAAGGCAYILVDPGVGDISNDPVLVSTNWNFPETLVPSGWHSNITTAFRLSLCNVTAGAIDPASNDFFWVIFNNP